MKIRIAANPQRSSNLNYINERLNDLYNQSKYTTIDILELRQIITVLKKDSNIKLKNHDIKNVIAKNYKIINNNFIYDANNIINDFTSTLHKEKFFIIILNVYEENLWYFISNKNKAKKLGDNNINKLIKACTINSIVYPLKHNIIRNKYYKTLNKKLLSNPKMAETLIMHTNLKLPKNFDKESINKLFYSYIKSYNSNINYIKEIINSKSSSYLIKEMALNKYNILKKEHLILVILIHSNI